MEKFRYTEVRVFFYLRKLQFKQSNFACTEHPGLTKMLIIQFSYMKKMLIIFFHTIS